jgi:drug/metabolite transporter (DMT)-like permease
LPSTLAWPRGRELWPSLAIVVASAGWGLFWLPLRLVEASGISGPWASAALFVPGLLALAPIALWRWRRLRHRWAGVALTGLFSGGAWVLYSNSLLYTEVVRALLLFYLTPIWSVVLARVVLDEPITPARIVTVGRGIGGLVVILGFEGGFPLPRNAGDWLGLASGVVWAAASVRLRRAPEVAVVESVFAYFLGGAALGLASAALAAPAPSGAVVLQQLPLLCAVSLGFIIPSMVLILEGTRRLSPVRVGILLMTEAVVGILSAAALSDEPFGAREIVGSALVIGAGVLDVAWVREPRRDVPRAP